MKDTFERVALEWASSLTALSYDSPAEDLPVDIERSVIGAVSQYVVLHSLDIDEDTEEDRDDATADLCNSFSEWIAEKLTEDLDQILDNVGDHFGLMSGPAIYDAEAAEFWLENMAEMEETIEGCGITGSISNQLTLGAFLVMCHRAENDVHETINAIDASELEDMLLAEIFGEK